MLIALIQNRTSGQSNLTQGCIAAAHGWFTGICQLGPMCTPPNTCFLGSMCVRNTNGTSTGSRTLHSWWESDVGHVISLKIAASHWQSGPHLIHGSLSHRSPHTKRHLDQFHRFYIDIKHRPFHRNRQMASVCTSWNTCFLGSRDCKTQTPCRSVQPFLHSS